MHHTEQYQLLEAKFRQKALFESDPMVRERLLTQADGWSLLLKASRYISETRAKKSELSEAE